MNSPISKNEWAQFLVLFAIGMVVCSLMMWMGSTQEYIPPVRKVWAFPAPPQLMFTQIVGVLGRLGAGLLIAALVVRCLLGVTQTNKSIGQNTKL